jgi:hypothetical protein
LAEARKVVDMPHGRYPITYAPDFVSTLLPHAQNARGMGNLMAYDAMLRAQDQDLDGALDSCRGILNAGRSVGDEPTLISMLVRVALDQMATGKIERVLAQGQPSEKALAAVQHLLEVEAEEPLLLIGVRGERGLMDGLMQAIQDGTVSYKSLQGFVSQQPSWGNPEALTAMQLALLPGAMKHNRAALLKFNNRLIEIAKRPVEEQRAPLAELWASERDLPWLARAFASPAKAVAAYHRDQASLRCAIVMVAVERYRRAHGRWPAALTDLVPAYLARVPIDPYDAAPLRLRPFPEGMVIYSVGPDGQDNGGNLSDRPDKEGTDLGFRLWDVAKRRQPPRPWQNDAED